MNVLSRVTNIELKLKENKKMIVKLFAKLDETDSMVENLNEQVSYFNKKTKNTY